jgi:hypothetical protein
MHHQYHHHSIIITPAVPSRTARCVPHGFASLGCQKAGPKGAGETAVLGGRLSRFLRPADFLASPPVTFEDARSARGS